MTDKEKIKEITLIQKELAQAIKIFEKAESLYRKKVQELKNRSKRVL